MARAARNSVNKMPITKLRVRRSSQSGINVIELAVVLAASLILTAISMPSFFSMRRNFRALGDARDVAAQILLAKMRASSDFTQARARFNTAANTFQLEIWDKTSSSWVLDAPTGTNSFSSGVTLGYGAQTNPPSGTQSSIGQAEACYSGASGASPGTAIANTTCVTFNSRGIPIDHTGATTSNDAIYITDGSGVYATTISATGLLKSWRIGATDTVQAHWNQR